MYRFLTPAFFLKIEKFLVPILLFATPSMFCIGIYYAFFNSPPDYQQGEMVRIMYIHVPSAWMSLGIYSFMSVCSSRWCTCHIPPFRQVARAGQPACCAIVDRVFAPVTRTPAPIEQSSVQRLENDPAATS